MKYQIEYLADPSTLPDGLQCVMHTDDRAEAGQILRAMGGRQLAMIWEWNGEFLQEAN